MDVTTQAPLPEYFRAEDHGKNWHLFCKHCKAAWKLAKESKHGGNLLHLLNHAYSHQK